MTRTIRLGILGVAHGHIYSYAAVAQTLPGVEIIGLTDHDGARARSAAAHINVPILPNADALLDLAPDAVIVCAENAYHAPLVLQAAPRVPYILCEKPIATTEDDALAMIRRCRETGAQLQIAFPVRHSPPIQRLRSLLAQGELGQVYSVKCTNHGGNPGGWFTDPILAGGGAVMDHTVHVMDLLRWFWQTEVVEVFAEIGVGLLHPGLAIDDVGLLTFRLANGVYGSLDTSWSRPPAYPTWGDVTIEVVGARGTLTVDAFQQHLLISASTWGKSRRVSWGSDMDRGLISEFVALARQGTPATITGTDGLAALRVALAAYASARSGLPVEPAHAIPGG